VQAAGAGEEGTQISVEHSGTIFQGQEGQLAPAKVECHPSLAGVSPPS